MTSYPIPLYAMLDVWRATGRSPEAFDAWCADRDLDELWCELLAMVRTHVDPTAALAAAYCHLELPELDPQDVPDFLGETRKTLGFTSFLLGVELRRAFRPIAQAAGDALARIRDALVDDSGGDGES